LGALKSAASAIIENAKQSRKLLDGHQQIDGVKYYRARQRLLCPLFRDLRSACVHQGSELKDSFLVLDQDIVAFAAAWASENSPGQLRMGFADGFAEDLGRIEGQAAMLKSNAESQLERCTAEIRDIEAELTSGPPVKA
jgi:hypothetical protein